MAPRTAAKAGKTPAGRRAAGAAAEEELEGEVLDLTELLPEGALEALLALLGLEPPALLGLEPPALLGLEPPALLGLEPEPGVEAGAEPPEDAGGVEPPAPRQEVSPVPAPTVKVPEEAGTPLASLIAKMRDSPEVALTTQVWVVPVSPGKVTMGLPPV
jgi:hypothetical protein